MYVYYAQLQRHQRHAIRWRNWGNWEKSSHVLPFLAVLAFLGRTLSFLGRMCNKVMHSNCLCDCDCGNAFFVENVGVCICVRAWNKRQKLSTLWYFVSLFEPLFLSQLNPAHDVKKNHFEKWNWVLCVVVWSVRNVGCVTCVMRVLYSDGKHRRLQSVQNKTKLVLYKSFKATTLLVAAIVFFIGSKCSWWKKEKLKRCWF